MEALHVLIAGPAGAGVFATSNMLGKTLLRHGYEVFITNEYPSLIRGGQQWALVVASAESPVYSHRRRVDLLLALDKQALGSNLSKLGSEGLAVCDTADKGVEDPRVVPLPFREAVKELGAPTVSINTVGVGAIVGALGGDVELLKSAVTSQFRSREVAEVNVKLAEKGYSMGVELRRRVRFQLKRLSSSRRLLIDGNSALALGLLAGGMTAFFSYPMTPASPILHFLAEIQREYGIVVFQPESELAAINMAIGAAYAGARAAVATSGGGFSLMVEALGQAAMTETPVVIVNVQRPGP
ncbi:MAG: 2-oxoacid:acceptor oxidoreductase family protein, partial [Thermofilum sp.]